jgi:hypothetical protein
VCSEGVETEMGEMGEEVRGREGFRGLTGSVGTDCYSIFSAIVFSPF